MRAIAMKPAAAVAVVVCLLSVLGAAHAAEFDPLEVPKVSGSITIDGRLDEPAWSHALVMGVNTEVRPGDNIPAPVETDMLLAYNETHFLVAFEAHDPDPTRIRASLCDRDRMWDDEWVVIGIDTYNEERGTMEFACNPLGVQGDNASGVYGDGNTWNVIWDSAGRITDRGYVVEMAIPFSSFRFQDVDGPQTWGVDAVRSYPREVRHHISLYPRDRNNNCYGCQMQKIFGFEGATPGRNIEIAPTFSAIRAQQREGEVWGPFVDTDESYDVGVTGRWGITPSTTLVGTVNPDFSQVEADVIQLDVNTRHALGYPEKRPFFLEGAGLLADVYTRTIADPTWGAKITSKSGRNGFGMLVARDEITNLLIPGSQLSSWTSLDQPSTAAAFAYTRDVGENGGINLSLMDREGDDYRNRVAGMEGELWLAESEMVEFGVGASRTDYPQPIAEDFDQPSDGFTGDAYTVQYNHCTSAWDWYTYYNNYDEDYRSDLTFRTSVGHWGQGSGAGHTWRADADNWFTMFNIGGGYGYSEEQDGALLSRDYSIWINYEGRRESFANLNGRVATDAFLGEEFDTWNVSFDAGLWPLGRLFTMVDGHYADAIDWRSAQVGRELGFTPYVNWKVGRHLDLVLRHEYERMCIDNQRAYTANRSYLKAVYQISRRSLLRAIVQYGDDGYNTGIYGSGTEPREQWVSSQVLFSYKINPQTVLYLGYSDAYFGDDDIDLVKTDRTFFAKIGYAWVI